MTSALKAVIYARVSTQDQNPEVQVGELVSYCEARQWVHLETIVDHGFSGGTDKRPGLQHLIKLARSRKIDVVVVAKLDRFARSLRNLVTMLDELSVLGVQFVSIRDHIDMTSASGRLLTHLLGAFAEFERGLIRERTIAGLAHARSKGRKLGRPRKRDDDAILELRTVGLSYGEIARRLGCSHDSVYRAVKAIAKSSSELSQQSIERTGTKND